MKKIAIVTFLLSIFSVNSFAFGMAGAFGMFLTASRTHFNPFPNDYGFIPQWVFAFFVYSIWVFTLIKLHMKKKTIPRVIILVFSIIFVSCNKKPSVEKQSVQEKMSYEKTKLILLLNNRDNATDVYGDSLKVNEFYALTKTKALIPVDGFSRSPGPGTISIMQFIDRHESMGNLQSDTVILFPIGHSLGNGLVDGYRKIDFIIYDITGLSVKASLQR